MANKREVSKAIRGLNEKTTTLAEDMYRNFFDNAQVGFFRTRLSDGKVLMANDRMAQMLGYSSAEEVTNDFFAGEQYVDAGTRERMVAELADKGEVKNFEARLRCRDGSAIWARFTARLSSRREYLEGVLVDVTEEKRAVEALRDSETRYRLLGDNAVDVVWSVGSDGRITYCSPSVHNLTGYRPDELIGKPFVDNLSSDSVLSVLPIWEEKAASRNLEEPVTIEVEFARKDGSTVWTEVIAAVRVDEHGNFAGAQGMAREITQRKHNERIMAAVNACLLNLGADFPGNVDLIVKTLGEILGAACVIYNRIDGETLQAVGVWNEPPSLKRTDKAAGHLCTDVVRAEEDFLLIRDLQNSRYADTDPNVRKYGLQTYLGHAVHLKGKHAGSLCAVFQVDREFTKAEMHALSTLASALAREEERNAVLGDLRESEERFRAVFETAQDSIFIKDRSLKYTHVNPAMEKLLRMTASELIGKTDMELFSEDEGGRNLELDSRVLRGEIVEEEYTEPLMGVQHTFSLVEVPMRDVESNIQGMFGIARDITDRKLAEEEIRKKNIELQAAIAVKMEFLSMVSHELRTPLVPIMGYSELLLDGMLGDLPKDAKDALRVIHKRSQDLKRLIEDLLLVSRMDQHAVRVESKPVSADHLVRSLVESYQALDQGKDVSFLQECEPCEIMADSERLKQVLHNLIGNAVKYSKESVVVTVRTGKRDENGFIQVSDNGIGIPGKHLPHIFERFYQVENLDTRTHEGTGLGLAITRELVELMGGTIQAESEPGVGTTFTIALPLAPKPEGGGGEGSDGPGVERSGRELSSETRRKRVLVVDDDPVTTRVVQGMLGDRYDVVTAPTASEALQIVRRNGIDLVLLDLLMSGMDGLSVLREVKSNESTKGVPVVLLSGMTEQDAIERGLESGAAGFVPKPFRKEDLVCLLQDLIGD